MEHAPPPRPEWLVGVTGTNGKTTTTTLVGHLLRCAGWRVTAATTVGATVDGVPVAARELDEVLAAGAGCRAIVQETTSFALGQGLTRRAAFDAAVFTNLTHDHLDQHGGSFEHYLAAKAQLFLSLARSPRERPVAVLPTASPATPLLAEVLDPRVEVRRWGWTEDGRPGPGVDLAGTWSEGGTTANGVRVPHPLVGRHLAENVLAALALVEALGVPLADAAASTASFVPVPGRFEVVNPGGDPQVVVDYAHSPDALDRTLQAARARARGRVWVVFGCGGERDPDKRPVMGAIAARGADEVIVTTDNPRGEDPGAIAAAILTGMPPGRGRRVDDRGAAIRAAVAEARVGDVVLVCGKGHEREQILAGGTVSFDDREIARSAWSDRGR